MTDFKHVLHLTNQGAQLKTIWECMRQHVTVITSAAAATCTAKCITGGQISNMAYQPYATEPEAVSMKAACANIPQLPSL